MIKRSLSRILKEQAKKYPVVTLTGPRQSGKTTLCRHIFNNFEYKNLEDPEILLIAQADPKSFLKTEKQGMIIDEFQRFPKLASYIQVLVDENKKKGQFILSGSQQLEPGQSVGQSLAGRTSVLKLLPFSYKELYGNKKIPINELLFKGFYPRIHDEGLDPSEALSSYVSTYAERDIRQISEVHNLRSFNLFLKLCASQIGQTINFSKMGSDIGVNYKTIQSWLSLLEASFLVFTLNPYFKNLKKRLVKSPKLYFYDVGLASYLLGAREAKHISALPNKGSLFENFIIADFYKRIRHSGDSPNIYFYRDSAGYEVDLLTDSPEGLDLYEIKMGATYNTDFSKNLNYYSKLNESVRKMSVIYSGDNNSVGDIQLISYHKL
jgi:hypothetical protein